ncbi:MAG TPA: hypothetical protein DCM45_05060 [Clostridiales bacterium]|nr:hypothetical protein [Clostridiales bacterium]
MAAQAAFSFVILAGKVVISMKNGQPKAGRLSRIRLTMILTLLSIIGIAFWNLLFPGPDLQITETSNMTTFQQSDSEQQLPAISDPIPIYQVGAVPNPGIYLVERGSYLYQLIEQAGGLLENAAAESINLALQLNDNQLVRIPTRDEVQADPAAAIGITLQTAGPMIDLNRADESQLEFLPGVGPSTAKAIVSYRQKNGPFQCVEDLMNVPGIKESRFNTLKDLVIIN